MLRIDTKNYTDLAMAGNRLVAMGLKEMQVINIGIEGNIVEALEDPEAQYVLEEQDTITSICLSKDGKYLLANVSLKNPRLTLWDLDKRECINKYKGHK